MAEYLESKTPVSAVSVQFFFPFSLDFVGFCWIMLDFCHFDVVFTYYQLVVSPVFLTMPGISPVVVLLRH